MSFRKPRHPIPPGLLACLPRAVARAQDSRRYTGCLPLSRHGAPDVRFHHDALKQNRAARFARWKSGVEAGRPPYSRPATSSGPPDDMVHAEPGDCFPMASSGYGEFAACSSDAPSSRSGSYESLSTFRKDSSGLNIIAGSGSGVGSGRSTSSAGEPWVWSSILLRQVDPVPLHPFGLLSQPRARSASQSGHIVAARQRYRARPGAVFNRFPGPSRRVKSPISVAGDHRRTAAACAQTGPAANGRRAPLPTCSPVAPSRRSTAPIPH